MNDTKLELSSVYDFAQRHLLNDFDAVAWYEMNFVTRDGRDKYGNKIKNWKGAFINYCKAMKEKELNGHD